jgi:hypothetical protein
LLLSYGTIHSCHRVSKILGMVQGVTLEEPTAVIPLGGFCEGGEFRGAMMDLNAHEAGNGGQSQGKSRMVKNLKRIEKAWFPVS